MSEKETIEEQLAVIIHLNAMIEELQKENARLQDSLSIYQSAANRDADLNDSDFI